MLRAELPAAAAEVSATLANAQAILDGISLEVSLAYRRVVAATELIELSRVAVVQAEEDLRLVRVKYRNGNATPTDIVDVETSLTRSRQNFYAAVYAQRAALARLNYALGLPPGDVPGKPGNPPEGQKTLPQELPSPRKLPELQ